MREIKFRAWDESNKIIHFDVEFIRSGTEGNDWIIFKSDKQTLNDKNVLDNPYFQKQIKLMQYTGIKDKNGVEIYEGDIVKAFIQDSHCLARVFWSPYNLTFMVEQICKFCKDTEYLSYQPKSIEVIGNIYENPELLEQQ